MLDDRLNGLSGAMASALYSGVYVYKNETGGQKYAIMPHHAASAASAAIEALPQVIALMRVHKSAHLIIAQTAVSALCDVLFPQRAQDIFNRKG